MTGAGAAGARMTGGAVAGGRIAGREAQLDRLTGPAVVGAEILGQTWASMMLDRRQETVVLANARLRWLAGVAAVALAVVDAGERDADRTAVGGPGGAGGGTVIRRSWHDVGAGRAGEQREQNREGPGGAQTAIQAHKVLAVTVSSADRHAQPSSRSLAARRGLACGAPHKPCPPGTVADEARASAAHRRRGHARSGCDHHGPARRGRRPIVMSRICCPSASPKRWLHTVVPFGSRRARNTSALPALTSAPLPKLVVSHRSARP